MLEFLYGKYFRVRSVGIENVPSDGPALLVANHSGGLPYDGAMLIYGVFRDHPAHRRLRTLVANFAFRSPWMSQRGRAHRRRARVDGDGDAAARQRQPGRASSPRA